MDRRHHFLQSRADTCIAACVCMVYRWCGRSPDEALVEPFGGLADALAPPRVVADAESVTTGSVAFLRGAEVWLANGRVLLAYVAGAAYDEALRASGVTAVSPHPGLTHGDGVELHAVIVCGIDDEDFLVLDPYFPAEEQPFRISQDRFIRCFAGYLVRVSMRG